MPARRSRLHRLLDALAKEQKRGSPARGGPTDPWHAILYENVVYLVDDDARERAFAVLKRHTRLDAAAINRCPDELLLEACGHGRMAQQQVGKLRVCAALFREVGDPRDLVRLPKAQARKALKRFPGIGDPGADKLLLLAGVEPVLALDSNGLRVLLRLGYGQEAKSYSTSYRSAQRAAMEELSAKTDVLVAAHATLRRHGKELCRQTAPSCRVCAVRRDCPSASAGAKHDA
jgi:endonuclease-3